MTAYYNEMEKYFNGKLLYGDDFSKEEIAKWYDEEAEAYADLYGKFVNTNKFPDETFDLITCISVLHHIPNVSFVLSELCRVLKPDGYLLLREPINSMGDWRTKRPGLTANERGIPKDYLSEIIRETHLQIVKKHYFGCMTSFLQRIFHANLFSSKTYLHIDKYLSKIFAFNIHYHPQNKIQRISPTYVFYVLKKNKSIFKKKW
jgi:ubiquinone/menaquinone biosynthesis C-methylase UbiE